MAKKGINLYELMDEKGKRKAQKLAKEELKKDLEFREKVKREIKDDLRNR